MNEAAEIKLAKQRLSALQLAEALGNGAHPKFMAST